MSPSKELRAHFVQGLLFHVVEFLLPLGSLSHTRWRSHRAAEVVLLIGMKFSGMLGGCALNDTSLEVDSYWSASVIPDL